MDAWKKRSAELAGWAWSNLVNRTDVWGGYLPAERRKVDESYSLTKPAKVNRGRIKLTTALLATHFAGASLGDVIGLHSTSPENTSKWAAIDIDRHDGKGDASANEAAAVKLYDFLLAQDYSPLLIDSNGDGGFHLWIIFDRPIPTVDAYHAVRRFAELWQTMGFASCPEQFPKQTSISVDKFGNWLRLPGRHHTRNHWAKVWNGETWLEGDEAIDHLLGQIFNIAPPAADLPTPPPPAELTLSDVELEPVIVQCLSAIPADAAYDEWLRVGMALHHLAGDGGLALWDAWSGRGSKYKAGECDRKWQTFSGAGDRRVGLGTLLRLARASGVSIDVPDIEPETAMQIAGASAAVVSSKTTALMVVAVDDEAVDPKPIVPHTTGQRPRIANVEDYSFVANKGKEQDGQRHVHIMDVARSTREAAGGWPAICNGQLFSVNHLNEPIYQNSAIEWIRNQHHLFAWMNLHSDVRWAQGESEGEAADTIQNLFSKQEFYEHLLHHSRRYDSVEVLPHEPKVKDFYYMPCALPDVDLTDNDTPLKQFISWFNPETKTDRDLLCAALLTPGWGGRSGARPAFVFTSNFGKGVGKTQTAEAMAYLWGGHIVCKNDENMAEFCARLMDAETAGKRIILLDNLKGRKSDADIESILTSSTISAKKMYVGARFIPNRFTWYITSNTPALSSDLAVRSIVIKLGKQQHGGRDFLSKARDLIDKHRPEILAELFEYMRKPKNPPKKFTDRWGDWQNDILGIFPNPEEIAQLVTERRPDVDSDLTDAEDIAAAVRNYISENGFDADRYRFFVGRQQMNQLMINEGLVSEKFGQRGIPNFIRERLGAEPLSQLKEHRTKDRRGWIWQGSDAPPADELVSLNDPQRKALAR